MNAYTVDYISGLALEEIYILICQLILKDEYAINFSNCVADFNTAMMVINEVGSKYFELIKFESGNWRTSLDFTSAIGKTFTESMYQAALMEKLHKEGKLIFGD